MRGKSKIRIKMPRVSEKIIIFNPPNWMERYKEMKKFAYSFVLLFFGIGAFGQAFVHNNGAGIYLTGGALMIIQNDSLINDLNGTSGLISNQGLLIVEGDIHNDAVIAGKNDSIKLTGDWINNDSYTGNNSWVVMDGNNQLITGDSVTTFNNLMLEGSAVVKRQTLNSITTGLLVLNDAELATDSNEMLVTNPSTSAITWGTGFVSSVDTGKLGWVTNSIGGYIFPTGSPSYINPPSIFRPVEITPASANSDTYAAALVKGDATADSFNVNDLDTILCAVNPNFYHHLYRVNGGDAAAISMYFDPSTDGNWTDEAHWQNNIWNYLGPSVAGTGLGLSEVTVAAVNDFVPYPFALAQKKFTFNMPTSVTIIPGQSVVLNPNIGAPSASFIWAPDTSLSCSTCDSPTASPLYTTHYTVKVTSTTGCTATDTVDVKVNGKFMMPDAFSPNGDGKNDLFGPLKFSLYTITAFRVYNRWGQLVHNSTDFWDGKFEGKDQPAGAYVYYIEVMSPEQANPSNNVAIKQEGSVMLMR